MDQYCLRSVTDYFLSAHDQKTCALDLYHWFFDLHCPWYRNFHVKIFLYSVPNGFILFKIIGGLMFIFMGIIVAATFIVPEYRQEVFVSSRLYQIAALIVRERPLILLSILIWSALQIGLFALTGF